MKKSILVRTNFVFKNVDKLQEYGFETEGSLIQHPLSKEFYQTMSLSEQNLRNSLELLLQSGQNIFIKIKEEQKFNYLINHYEVTFIVRLEDLNIKIYLLCNFNNKPLVDSKLLKLFILKSDIHQFFHYGEKKFFTIENILKIEVFN